MNKDIFDYEVPKGKGILCVLGGKGDTKIFWNKKNAAEVENARQTFNNLVKVKKFAAFSVSKLGRRNKKITEFDPKIQKLILIPPMQGGASLLREEFTEQVCAPNIGSIGDSKAIQRNDEAEIKAMTLLKKKIGEEKFIKLVATGYLEIKGKYGIYRMNNETVLLDKFDKIGKKTRPLTYTLCVNVSKKVGYIPLADKILSLYLSIIEDEDKFIETANFRYVNTKDEFSERGETS